MTLDFILTLALGLLVGLPVYAAVTFGLAAVLGHSRISLPLRRAVADFSWLSEWWRRCPQCDEESLANTWPRAPEVSPVLFGLACPDCAAAYYAKSTFPQRELPDQEERPVRPLLIFVELLECPMCLGFWQGGLSVIAARLYLGVGVVPWATEACWCLLTVALGFFTVTTNLLLARWTGLTEGASHGPTAR